MLEKAKLEQKLKYEKNMDEKEDQNINAKLPGLVITKYKGIPADCGLRFWNQFTAEIDSADVPPVTEFSYLKELLDPQVRTSVVGLPFTTEGHERTKNILKTRYGKESEIVNAYITDIMALAAYSRDQPKEDFRFLQKAMFECPIPGNHGQVRLRSQWVCQNNWKLEGIRGDLV